MSNLFTKLQEEQARQHKLVDNHRTVYLKDDPSQDTQEVTQKVTQTRDESRDHSRETAREKSRENTRNLPTRDEIQEFSFRLRDALNAKVQAEVPHQWQKELDDIAHELDVKKLELYRFIIGEFLGKVARQNST